MKKIYLLILVSILSGCINAGNNDFFSSRKNFFSYINGYGIYFYNQADEPFLVKSEFTEERNYKLNQSMTAYKGYSVLNNKIYRKDFYQREYVTPNMDGKMYTASIPHKFKKGEKIKLIGQVMIEHVDYRLVPSGLKDFVFLLKEDGELYSKMGQIKGDSLILLDATFYPYPKTLRLVDITSSKSVQSEPTQGFDVKYDGLRLDRIWFTVMDYSRGQGEQGTFENISFPNKPGLIEINGIGFRVLNADADKIDYMVLKN